jgi:CDP-glucose 4,6-dehydratase
MDLCDVPSIRHVINEKGCDILFHLAANASAADVLANPYEGFETNVTGTYNVLEAARLARGDGIDVRVVIASSQRVYGDATPAPVRETARLAPRDPYEASKACADRLAYCYAKTYGVAVGIARLANVYDDPSSSRRDRPPGGDWVHVDDAVEALLAIERSLDSPEHFGRAWNVGGDSVAADEVLDTSAIRGELGWQPERVLDQALA